MANYGHSFNPGYPDFVESAVSLVEEYDRNFAKFAVGLDAVHDLVVDADRQIFAWRKVVKTFVADVNAVCDVRVLNTAGLFTHQAEELVVDLVTKGLMCEVDVAHVLNMWSRMQPCHVPLRNYDTVLRQLLRTVSNVINYGETPDVDTVAYVNKCVAVTIQKAQVGCAGVCESFSDFVFTQQCV